MKFWFKFCDEWIYTNKCPKWIFEILLPIDIIIIKINWALKSDEEKEIIFNEVNKRLEEILNQK